MTDGISFDQFRLAFGAFLIAFVIGGGMWIAPEWDVVYGLQMPYRILEDFGNDYWNWQPERGK